MCPPGENAACSPLQCIDASEEQRYCPGTYMYIKQPRIGVERQLEMLEGKRCKDNFLSDEISPLTHLQQQNNILIKPADKISAVVVFNNENYIEKLTDNKTSLYLSEAFHRSDFTAINGG